MCAANRDCEIFNARSVCRADGTCSEPVLVGDDVAVVGDAADDATDGGDGDATSDVGGDTPSDTSDVGVDVDPGCTVQRPVSCSGVCVDSMSDPLNCGGCGRRCGTTEYCAAGRCESSSVRAVCAGGDFTCALMNSSRTVRCFGSNDHGQAGAPPSMSVSGSAAVALPSRATDLACGLRYACALTEAREVWCWGENTNGQLGDGTTTSRHTAARVVGLPSSITRVATGRTHVCAVTATQELYCWGAGAEGELGETVPDAGRATAPVMVAGLSRDGVLAVAAGSNHTCGVIGTGSTGELRCWGNTLHGVLGRDPTRVWMTPSVNISLGSIFGCVLTEASMAMDAGTAGNDVHCWGGNSFGALGVGMGMGDSQLPLRVASIANVRALATGSRHSCALHGTPGALAVSCWGSNSLSESGAAATTNVVYTPSAVTVPGPVTAVAAGYSHSCAVGASNALYCWGGNTAGALGRPTPSSSATPLLVRF